jgi:hypothetical protein
MPCTLTQIGHTQSPYFLCGCLRYDLGGPICPTTTVPHNAHARTATLADCLAQLPWSNVCLTTTTRGRVRARIGNLRITLGVAGPAFVNHGRESIMLRGRRRVCFVSNCECAVGHKRLIVWKRVR